MGRQTSGSASVNGTGTAVDRAAVAATAVGLALAVLLMVIGLLAAAFGEGATRPDDLRPGHLLPAAVRGDPAGLVAVGVAVLLVTPALRLIVLAFGFGRRREWLFVGLTGLVLVELVVSALLVSAR